MSTANDQLKLINGAKDLFEVSRNEREFLDLLNLNSTNIEKHIGSFIITHIYFTCFPELVDGS